VIRGRTPSPFPPGRKGSEFFPGLVAVVAMVAVVAGCASVPGPAPVADPDRAFRAREARLAAVSRWTAFGRLAIITPEDSVNVSMRWRQRGDAYEIRLTGPLGQGAVELSGDRAGVVLRTPEETWTSPDPESLMRERLGWSVPVAGLRFWILGRSDPRSVLEALDLDAAGRPAELRQGGWKVRYLRYGEQGEALDLPTKVFLDSGQVSARMVLRRWELGG